LSFFTDIKLSLLINTVNQFFIVQVKLTMERLKAGWEDTLREREEFSERKIKNIEEQKDKGVHLVLVFFSFSIGMSVSFCEFA